MDDWLQLTEEDIARAHRLLRVQPPMPEAVIVGQDDAAAAPPPVPGSPVRRPPLRITLEDLTPSPPQGQGDEALRRLERLMFDLTLQERAQHVPAWLGTAALTWHEGLAAVARGHANDMMRRHYIAHVSPEGVSAAQRVDQYGIRYLACGENIGVVYGEASHGEQAIYEIHHAFMNQPRSLTNHRGNLLNPIWTHMGIGIACQAQGSLIATQLFMSAPAARLRGR